MGWSTLELFRKDTRIIRVHFTILRELHKLVGICVLIPMKLAVFRAIWLVSLNEHLKLIIMTLIVVELVVDHGILIK